MGKTPDFKDWKWPWTPGEVDEEKAAQMIHKLKKGFEDLQDTVGERDKTIATLTTDLDDAKAAKSGTDEEAQAELKELRKENRELKSKSTEEAKSLPADEKTIWQLKAAVQFGLTEKQALRLQGDDLDAIKDDAKDFAKDLGIEIDDDGDLDGDDGQGGAGDDGAGDGSKPPVQQPRTRYKTGAHQADRINVTSDPEAAKLKLPALFD